MPANNLGNGPYNGYAPRQTVTSQKDSEHATTRAILRSAWNGQYASGTYNGKNRIITPFRAVNNSGDFLARVNYSCGGPNPTNLDKPGRAMSIGSIPKNCDLTGVPASSCNVKYVADSSNYTTFKKQQAINRTYNDSSFGGDSHNGSYTTLTHIRRR